MRIGRRRSLSTHTPAGSVKRMNGSISKKNRSDASNVVAPSVRIAIVGIAIVLTWLPNRLIVAADHSLRKSRWWMRLRRVVEVRAHLDRGRWPRTGALAYHLTCVSTPRRTGAAGADSPPRPAGGTCH